MSTAVETSETPRSGWTFGRSSRSLQPSTSNRGPFSSSQRHVRDVFRITTSRCSVSASSSSEVSCLPLTFLRLDHDTPSHRPNGYSAPPQYSYGTPQARTQQPAARPAPQASTSYAQQPSQGAATAQDKKRIREVALGEGDAQSRTAKCGLSRLGCRIRTS